MNKIIKRLIKNSTREYYSKNIEFLNSFKKCFETNTASQSLYIENPLEYVNRDMESILGYIYYDCLAIRDTEDSEWKIIPLSLLIKALYGNLKGHTLLKKYLMFKNACNFITTREEFFKITTYGVFINEAAGDYYITELDENDYRQEGFYTCYYEFPIFDDAKLYVDNRKEETTVYAVFESLGEYFYSQENDFSGNWRGSKYGRYNYVAEFKTEDEAENYINQYKEVV